MLGTRTTGRRHLLPERFSSPEQADAGIRRRQAGVLGERLDGGLLDVDGPEDLEGKTVGAAGVPSDRPLLDAVVRSSGGDPAQVRMRNIGYTLSPALAAGRVDAVIGAYWNVEQVELEEQGVEVRAFRLEEHGVPDYDELVVVTSDEVARERPELVRAFLAGLRRGQDWAATDQAGAVRHLLDANEVLLLRSPPWTPAYNGACEAGTPGSPRSGSLP